LLGRPLSFPVGHSLGASKLRLSGRWISKLAGSMARMQGRVIELLGQSLHQQVARVLLHEGEDGHFPFPQEVCAALLGASRPSVNQVLKEFETEGLVRLSYGLIEVLDEKQIIQIAD
jgi:CRP/FNR family transcriptional regulator, cAMP and macrophage regulator